MYNINNLSQIILGRQGENKATTVEIDVSEWLAEYPNADINVLVMRNGDTAPYIAVTNVNNNILSWAITVSDTQYSGRGKAEIRATVNDIIKKSATAVTYVTPSLEGEPSPTPPEPSQDWVNEVIAAKESIENMSATAEVDNNVGTPRVVVTKSEVEGHTNLDFQFYNLKGETGDVGNVDQHYDPTSTKAQSGTAVAEAVAPKADKTYVDTQLNGKADSNSVYTKSQADSLLNNKANLSYVNEQLSDKADKANTYTKTETENYVSGATANFITKAVSDLTNYYLKSETYTRAEVQALIAQIQTAHFEIVQELPATGETNVIYLVPRTTTETGNIYDEYIYISNAYEKIGSTDVDLTGYATETWVNTQIANFLTQSQVESIVNTALTNYYTKAQNDTLLQGKADINNILPYIDYTISNNEVTITNLKYDKTNYNSSDKTAYIINSGHYTIPDIIEGCPVRYIKQGAFSKSNVKIDKFPATLKEIGVGNIDSGTVTNISDLPQIANEYDIYYVTSELKMYQYFNDTWNAVAYDIGAFSNQLTMTNLVIPEGVTKIGQRSFLYNNNVTVYIPASVTTIENQAFAYSSTLTTAIIDSAVIGGFQTCSALAIVKLNNINTETISNYAFGNCTSITSIILPENVKTIGARAFSSCSSLASINIPNSVTTIGNGAFANTALTSIYLPKNVSLGTDAFQNVALTNVYYGGSQSEWQAHLSDRGYAQIDNISGVTIHYNQEYAKLADILGYHDSTKQNTLTAGDNISILSDTISANVPVKSISNMGTALVPDNLGNVDITIRKTTLDQVLVPNACYDLGSTAQASLTLTLPTPSGTDNYFCNDIYVAFKSGSTATALSIVGTYEGDTSYLPSADSICELSFKYVCGTWVLVTKETAISA